MSFYRLLAGLLCLATLHTVGTRAFAQERPRLPSQEYNSDTKSVNRVEKQSLPAVNTEALRAEDQKRDDRVTPYRYGTLVSTQFRPKENGTWERLPSGRWLWRLRIQSRDAVSLSLHFPKFRLPDGASLFVYDPKRRLVRGPYTGDDATNGQHWTPLVRGEEIVVELEVPRGHREAVDLRVGDVVHGYRSLTRDRTSPAAKAGECNLDVACDESVPWRQQVRSVGRYTYDAGGSALVCSGSLINNTSEDETPYFLTAEHCIFNEERASSMVFYWNYQNATCRKRGSDGNGAVTTDDPAAQTSSGAVLRMRYGNCKAEDGQRGCIDGKPDLSLVEIDDEIPDDYELYFSGWTREGTATTKSTTIHHPQGHGKRISFDQDPSSVTGFGDEDLGNTHLRIGNWEVGTTEGGSSGSPLYDSDQKIVGVLSGGLAGCNGGVDDNNSPDWYGRLAPGFSNGDYIPPGETEPTTLADVLDPDDTEAQTLDGRNLSSSPPGPVSNFKLTSTSADSATLQWRAAGDDGDDGTAFVYDLRVQKGAPIDSEEDFLAARKAENVPLPEPSGTPQTTTIAVEQDTNYYFAIKALDEALQSSERVTISARPVADLRVTEGPFPNPTRGRARFEFAVEEPQTVRAVLYDPLGRRVRTLFRRKVLTPFQTRVVESDFSSLASGVYFLRLQGKSSAQTEKIVVVK